MAYNSGLLMCGRAFQTVVSVVLLSFIARYLGQEAFGTYGYVIAFAELFSIVVPMGLPRVVVREVSRDRRHTASYLGDARCLMSTLAAVLSFVLFVLAWVIVPDRGVLPAILIYFVSQAFFFVAEAYFAVFRGYERMGYQTLVIFASRSIMLALVLVSIYLDLGLTALFMMVLIANVAHLLLAHYLLVTRFLPLAHRLDLRAMINLAKNAFPVGVSFILRTYLWQSAVILAMTLRGQAAAGVLYGPLRLVEQSKVLPFAFVASMLPVLASQADSSKKEFASSFQKAFKLSLIGGALGSIAFTSLSGYAVPLLLGAGFPESVEALELLGWAPALLFPNLFLGVSLVALDKQILEALTLLGSLMVSVACNVILIPRYGVSGACYSILVAEGLFFILSSTYLWRYLASGFLVSVTVRIWICTLLSALIVYLGGGRWDIVILPTSFLVFAGGLVVVGAVDRDELVALRSLVYARPGG